MTPVRPKLRFALCWNSSTRSRKITTINIGGGLPVPYSADEVVPTIEAFAAAIFPLLEGYDIILNRDAPLSRMLVIASACAVCQRSRWGRSSPS